MNSDYFITLCDDDILRPGYLEFISQYLNYDLIGTGFQNFGHSDDCHQPTTLPFVTAVCSKELWERAGGYDPLAGMAADWDFYWTCKEVGARIKILGEPMFLRRTHPGQISHVGNWDYSFKYIRNKHGTNWP